MEELQQKIIPLYKVVKLSYNTWLKLEQFKKRHNLKTFDKAVSHALAGAEREAYTQAILEGRVRFLPAKPIIQPQYFIQR